MSGTEPRPDVDAAPGMPCWVKVSGIIAIVVTLTIAALHLTGNRLGGHGSRGTPAEHGPRQP